MADSSYIPSWSLVEGDKLPLDFELRINKETGVFAIWSPKYSKFIAADVKDLNKSKTAMVEMLKRSITDGLATTSLC